jgi:hypothetical protein
MAMTTDDRPTQERTRPKVPSLREMFTIHRDGPVTSGERRRSAIGAVVAVVVLAGAVGVIHLIDGSRRFDGSDVVLFGVVAVVLAALGCAFPRFTTTPGLAMMSRSPDRNSLSSRAALVVVVLIVLVVGAVRVYY